MKAKKLASAAILLASAMCIGIIENLIPPVFPFLPYVKIGFSNIVIITAILLLDIKFAVIIVVLKSVAVPLILGNPVMILYSLPASVISTLFSFLLLSLKKPGIPAISIFSAILHNLSQLCTAAIMTNSLVFGYAPYFILTGALSGFATGIIVYFVIKSLPKNLLNL